MKKFLVLLVVLLCALCAFARSSINVNVIPYGVEYVSIKEAGADEDAEPEVTNSTFLMGGEVVFQTETLKGFFAEAGIGSTASKLKALEKAFANVYVFGGAGYQVNLGKVVGLSCHLDAAGDFRFVNNYTAEEPENIMTFGFALKTGTAIHFRFNNTISVKAGCDGMFAFNDKSIKTKGTTSFVSYRILPVVGMTISF